MTYLQKLTQQNLFFFTFLFSFCFINHSFAKTERSPHLPFEKKSRDELVSSKKKVFAHYFTQFPLVFSNQGAFT